MNNNLMRKMKIFSSQLLVLVLMYCCVTSLAWRPLRPRSWIPLQAESNTGPLEVDRGQLTFDAEGNDNPRSIFFSRIPHVPTSRSGITLGRGYDMKERKQPDVLKHLRSIGIPETTAKKFSNGVRLTGQKAKDYLKKNGLESHTITHEQQKELFYIAYDAIAADAKRLATKKDVVEMYGETDWENLNNAIREVVIDLRYRGDYTPATRKKIQRSIAANDLKLFTELMSDQKYWLTQIGVPKDRFQRRMNYLVNAG